MLRLWIVVAALVLAEAALLAAFPKHRGYVNDFAKVLSEGDASGLEQLLRDTEKQTSAEIAVVTVGSLDGMTIEDYANRLFKEWGIGKKAADNGVLILVAPSERRVRIEPGYGLEAMLPDGLAGEIIRNQFAPAFRRGDYAAGIRAGVDRIIAIVRRDPSSAAAATAVTRANGGGHPPPALFVIPFVGAFVSLGGFAAGIGVRNRIYGPMLFGALFAGVPLLMALLVSFGLTLAVLVPLMFAMMALGYRKGGAPFWTQTFRAKSEPGDADSGWVMGSTSSDSSSSDPAGDSSASDSSSSDSSFGGGESGGGGASGSW